VPPDYFSADGQLWGNPLYTWEQAQRDHFAFWRTRVAEQLRRFDLVRIDHFRGLAAYWGCRPEPPPHARTLVPRYPGGALFEALAGRISRSARGCRDLGVITPDVEELRSALDSPACVWLQFAFDGSPDNPHLPHNYARRQCGLHRHPRPMTHGGLVQHLDREQAERVEVLSGCRIQSGADSMMRACLSSVAQLAIIPGRSAQVGLLGALSTRPNGQRQLELEAAPRKPDGRPLAQQFRRLSSSFGREHRREAAAAAAAAAQQPRCTWPGPAPPRDPAHASSARPRVIRWALLYALWVGSAGCATLVPKLQAPQLSLNAVALRSGTLQRQQFGAQRARDQSEPAGNRDRRRRSACGFGRGTPFAGRDHAGRPLRCRRTARPTSRSRSATQLANCDDRAAATRRIARWIIVSMGR